MNGARVSQDGRMLELVGRQNLGHQLGHGLGLVDSNRVVRTEGVTKGEVIGLNAHGWCFEETRNGEAGTDRR